MLWACLLPLISLAQPATTSSADSLYERAKYFYYNNYDSAIRYLRLVSDISAKINYSKGKANALAGFGAVAASDHERLKFYIEALEIRTTIHDSVGVGASLQTIGAVYARLNRIELANDYVNRSIKIKTKTRDYGGLALSYITLGRWYMAEKNYKEASIHFRKALIYRKLEGKPQGLGYALINLAELKKAQHQPDTALSLALKAKGYFLDANDQQGLVWSYRLMGDLLVTQKPKEANQFYLSALNLDPNSLNGNALEARKGLASLRAAEGQFEKAYQQQKQYDELYSISLKQSGQDATQQLAAEYEYQLKEKEKAREAEREAQKISRRNNLQFISISIGVLSVFSILLLLRQKVSVRILNPMIFLAFLFLFEFLFVLADPTVARLSAGQPYIQLFTNAALALSILPVQQWLENWVKRKISNQRSQLA